MKHPNCYKCKFRQNLVGDFHSKCANKKAKVTGNTHGIRHGWFNWPYNFDPMWLESCNGIEFLDKYKGSNCCEDNLLGEPSNYTCGKCKEPCEATEIE